MIVITMSMPVGRIVPVVTVIKEMVVPVVTVIGPAPVVPAPVMPMSSVAPPDGFNAGRGYRLVKRLRIERERGRRS